MKTIADKNRFETELRCTPSNIGCKRKRLTTVKWVALGVVAVMVGWFAVGYANAITTDPNVELKHILIAFAVLRWFFGRRVSIIKTTIIIIIITAIFN